MNIFKQVKAFENILYDKREIERLERLERKE